jgi:ABC-type phosphate/phosphonate transport system substrate-binding protein
MNRKSRYLAIGLLLLAALLVSCRRLPKAPPTARPTLTPTPRSTALPPVPTIVPVGSEGNPVHILVVSASGAEEGYGVAITTLEKALLDATQVNVKFDVVQTDAEALNALCASPDGTVSSAWLGGLAYAAAYAQDCGSAALVVERGQGTAASTGDEARVVAHSSLDANGLSNLAGHSFCRLGYTDLYSWIVPAMMLKASGVNPADLREIRDYTDANALLNDVAAGTCDAAGIANSAFEELNGARPTIRTLQQSASIPYEVFVVPPLLPQPQAQALVSALVSLGNGTRGETLNLLLNQDRLNEVGDDDFAPLRSLIQRAGIDLAQAGS